MRRTAIWLTSLLLLSLGSLGIGVPDVAAQAIDSTTFADMEARSIGPAGVSGRVTAIAVTGAHDDTWYVGTGSGGVWKTTDGGTTYEPIFDDQPATSVGDVTVHPQNPDLVWVGTGEGNPRNSSTEGNGVYVSRDGGETWTHAGLENTRSIHRLLVHPDDPSVAYAGAQGGTWAYNEERGVYKTTDGGETWEKILFVNEKTGVADMVMDPENPDKLFVAMWEYRRWPWFFESGGPGSGLYVTHDGGQEWTELDHENGLPKDTLGRMGLAIAPSDPERVYAYVEKDDNALYRSDDGGSTWQMINKSKGIGDRPFYYADLRVDPQNKNRVYSLASVITMSEDGGKSFEELVSYSEVHPDHHAMWIDPEDPSHIINGNDGGLAISHDYGDTWRVPTNLPLSQFYHINVDNDIPYNVCGGMQDNGSWCGPGEVWRDGGIRNHYWSRVGFGDGFDVVPDPENPRFGYSMWQGGNLLRYDKRTGGIEYIRPQHPNTAMPDSSMLRFNWNAAIAQDPNDPNTLYYGSQFVHKSTDEGDTWEIISPDLTTDNPAWQKQQQSGGLTYDVTEAENFTTITAIAPSPTTEGVIWAGTDDGQLHVTRNGGESWTNVMDNIEGVPENTWVHQVKASTYRPSEAFVVFDNHRRGDWTPYVYHTTDYGESWERLVGPDDVDGYTLSFLQDPVVPDLLFVGTQLGLHYSLDGGETWREWEAGFPTAQTRDLALQRREKDLVIGTFGRSAYVLDDIQPLRTLASRGTDVLDEPLTVFEAPDATLATMASPKGAFNPADAMYRGENEPDGAMITYAVTKPDAGAEAGDGDSGESGDANGSSDETETSEVTVEIVNEAGEVIRTLKEEPSDGVNRMTWGLNRKGVRGPTTTQEEAEKRDRQPGGPEVAPGTYTARFSYRGSTDSTTIRVKPDPRIDGVTQEERMALKQMQERMMDRMETATTAADRIRSAKKTIEAVQDQLEGREDSTAAAAREKGATMRDSLDRLMHQIVSKDYEGIRSDPTTVNARLGNVGFYLGTQKGAPTETERLAMQRAEQRLQMAVDDVNAFFEDEWPAYKETVEAADPSFFDDYEPIEMK